MAAPVAAIASTSSASRVRFRVTFNFVMALLMAAIVIYGFSHTIGANLIHPSIPPPRLLYVHAALFTAFMGIYILQTGLIASGNVALHQRLGRIWVVIGAALPVVGVATVIVMRRFEFVHAHQDVAFQDVEFIGVLLWQMLAFAILFLLAVLWRKRPEYHRRLMFLATCSLMSAGLSRFPLATPAVPPANWFWYDFIGQYAGIAALVLIAMTRDFIVQHRVHIVYRVALPLMVIGFALACALSDYHPGWWTALSHRMLGV